MCYHVRVIAHIIWRRLQDKMQGSQFSHFLLPASTKKKCIICILDIHRLQFKAQNVMGYSNVLTLFMEIQFTTHQVDRKKFLPLQPSEK